MVIGFRWESQKKIDHYEEQHVAVRNFEREDGVVWTGLIWVSM
jgi:hypothetical protein